MSSTELTRDRLIHYYRNRKTNLRRIWVTVEKAIPESLRILEPLIKLDESVISVSLIILVAPQTVLALRV